MNTLEYILLVALCAACISYTICWTAIFKWLRELLSNVHPKLEELIHCPYCFSHYVVLTIMLTTENISQYLVPITSYTVYNFLFTWFAIVCIVSLLHFVMLRTYKPVMDYMADRYLMKEQEKRRRTLNAANTKK